MTAAAPFDAARLDALMAEAGLDAVLATSKHGIRYLLGGYRFFLYAHGDAHGLSRYLPIFIYPQSDPARAAYVGTATERHEAELGRIWVGRTHFANRTVADYARSAVTELRRLGRPLRRIGVEMDFLPQPAFQILRDGLPGTEIVNANLALELLRAVKTPAELAILREASEKVEAAMVATFARHGAGATKNQIIATLRREEIARGLEFEYALVNIGTAFNRAPSDQPWRAGGAGARLGRQLPGLQRKPPAADNAARDVCGVCFELEAAQTVLIDNRGKAHWPLISKRDLSVSKTRVQMLRSLSINLFDYIVRPARHLICIGRRHA